MKELYVVAKPVMFNYSGAIVEDGYLVKEPPLPVKFIIDAIGPVNLETDDFYII